MQAVWHKTKSIVLSLHFNKSIKIRELLQIFTLSHKNCILQAIILFFFSLLWCINVFVPLATIVWKQSCLCFRSWNCLVSLLPHFLKRCHLFTWWIWTCRKVLPVQRFVLQTKSGESYWGSVCEEEGRRKMGSPRGARLKKRGDVQRVSSHPSFSCVSCKGVHVRKWESGRELDNSPPSPRS